MFTILLIICITLVYFIFSYLFLLQMEKKINSIQNMLFQCSDQRFTIFETLLNKSLNLIDYNQTFLKEIVQLRSQSTMFKKEEDLRAAFFCEEKISQIANKINIFFEEFPILNRVENSESIQKEIIEMEKNMLDLKNKYNKNVIGFNRTKSMAIFIPLTSIIDRFNDKIELWKITP